MLSHPGSASSSSQQSALSRRKFLKTAAVAGGVAWIGGMRAEPAAPPKLAPAQTVLPRWRGFNLCNFYQAFDRGERGLGHVVEDDLRWMRDWGFNFVRLPMDYWLWVDSDWRQTRKLNPDDVGKFQESTLAKIDRTVELCRKHGLHLSLNFHRAPGYCVNQPEREPFVLWKDRAAEDAFVQHWEVFARRYREVPTSALSFNLLNEAPAPRAGYMSREDYARVMQRATARIREISAERLIIVDGLSCGYTTLPELASTGVAQSVHAYTPSGLSHYRASWADRKGDYPLPTWPLKNKDGSINWDRARLETWLRPWAALARQGIGVHCGECGCYNKTPYAVFAAWFEDVLQLLTGHGIGYALWEFRGSFGVLDSGRTDTPYEDWHGHKLDRRLLTLLQKY
ncbi:MAG: cellulase family glycosylhydrolase [Opitutae bacterium]|nr:cellulase family glycosylhydrolase [Opitutae bacterium]